jgi:hypothetical protein
MKTPVLLILLAFSTSPALAGNWFGSGPWANATYYPGNLDGKYQAAVTGINTSGVLGFAIRDGSPPFLEVERQSTGDALVTDSVVVNQEIEIDRSLNYYAIFVNGRTFVGTTAAGVNYDNSSVNGTLIGTQPTTVTTTNKDITSQLITNITVAQITNTVSEVTPQTITNIFSTNVTSTNLVITNINGLAVTNEIVVTNSVTGTNLTNILITNFVEVPSLFTNTVIESVLFTNDLINPVIITTGVDGAFQANVNGKRGIFTFQGPGQLSAPGPVVDGQQVNPVTAFNVNGIRVSFSSQANFQQLNSAR